VSVWGVRLFVGFVCCVGTNQPIVTPSFVDLHRQLRQKARSQGAILDH
jgi:hypothetical protein